MPTIITLLILGILTLIIIVINRASEKMFIANQLDSINSKPIKGISNEGKEFIQYLKDLSNINSISAAWCRLNNGKAIYIGEGMSGMFDKVGIALSDAVSFNPNILETKLIWEIINQHKTKINNL